MNEFVEYFIGQDWEGLYHFFGDVCYFDFIIIYTEDAHIHKYQVQSGRSMFKVFSEIAGNFILIQNWNSFNTFYGTQVSYLKSNFKKQTFYHEPIQSWLIWRIPRNGSVKYEVFILCMCSHGPRKLHMDGNLLEFTALNSL